MKERYEISLWEDYLNSSGSNLYEERKLCVIGSDSMTAENRAYFPRLVNNINGTHSFTFKMYYCLTDENGTKYQNPFLNLLVNERKVKVFWHNEWYDFVIKNCQEDSSGKFIEYTCQDLFINELSKNGFEIEFDSELMNNQDTIDKLAERVLEGTDWRLGDCDVIQQLQEEPTYSAVTLYSTEAKNETRATTSIIPANKEILIFYSQFRDIIASESTGGTFDLQFAYSDDYRTDLNSQLVINADCYVIKNTVWSKDSSKLAILINGTIWFEISLNALVTIYRAKRLVTQPRRIFDPLTNQYVSIYKALSAGTGIYTGLFNTGDEIYGYDKTEYSDPIFVNNLIVNGSHFGDFNGWGASNSTGSNGFYFQLYPKYNDSTILSDYAAKSYLRLISASPNTYFYNAALQLQTQFLPNGISNGDQFCYRIKLKSNSNNEPGSYITNPANYAPCAYAYSISGSTYVINGDNVFQIDSQRSSNDWLEYHITCQASFTRAELNDGAIGLFLKVAGNQTVWVEEAEFFPLRYDVDGNRINPGDFAKQSIAVIYHKFYNHTTSAGLIDADDVKFIYSGAQNWDLIPTIIAPQMNENFEKIRSIDISNSNRFNILQELAATFECWVRFTIQHDENTGRVLYDDSGLPLKFVTFVSTVGQETGLNFVYGLDLKQIQRTIQSNQIATKTIVKPNNNEFATNGFCTIARSPENYARANFIFNFDYYIASGLMDGNQLNVDLYDNENGYYTILNRKNTQYDALTEIINQIKTEIIHQQAYQKTYRESQTSTISEIANLKNEISRKAGVDIEDFDDAIGYLVKNENDVYVSSRIATWRNQEAILNSIETSLSNIEDSLNLLASRLEAAESQQSEIINTLKEIEFNFYKKYSRFIQEGSWTDEQYIDDTLYYLDALSVAYTASRPQVQYNISVIRLSALDEFQNRTFALGDIAAIQDTEFFGYLADGITPYREKVLITEIVFNFDSPEQDSFKIQNYKTQFEDLFQRITATTQSLQYSSGEYAKAASIVEADGTIKAETLQNSIALNNELVFSAQNEMVTTDNTGVTVRDVTDPNAITKLTSGGIFISTDGGKSWKNAVRGQGIATQFLTAGLINANQINIMDGDHQTFRWDSTGINAYDAFPIGDTQKGINLSKFVRFDHYGIYGINSLDGSNFNPDIAVAGKSGEELIWDTAQFGLTWNGFFLKNRDESGMVEISSENDFQVLDENDYARIKIGRISGSTGNYLYGIRIKNGLNEPVLETGDDGELWLRNMLSVGTSESQTVYLGYNENAIRTSSNAHEVFHAGDDANKFVVYEDGYIQATGGKIGNLTISQIEETGYKVKITTDKGTIFDESIDRIILTATLYNGSTEITNNVGYQWKKKTTSGWQAIAGATNASYTALKPTDASGSAIDFYRCDITYPVGGV